MYTVAVDRNNNRRQVLSRAFASWPLSRWSRDQRKLDKRLARVLCLRLSHMRIASGLGELF